MPRKKSEAKENVKDVVKADETLADIKAEPVEVIEDAKDVEAAVEPEASSAVPAKSEELASWIPKTKTGKDVVEGKYKSIDDIFEKGGIILEPQIVDYLIPDIKQDVVFVGGSPGKGGGIKRTPTRMTARMHKSGRRYRLSAVVIVGNENGIVGIGKATSNEHRSALQKALNQAKINIVRVRRGCGSWECNCGGDHSIPFSIEGKMGSVKVKFYPAPKGIGIVADEESKKILKLAGIKDVWVRAFGSTATRINLAFAVIDALKNLNKAKGI
jgi:small subunit ribosomal protein S5